MVTQNLPTPARVKTSRDSQRRRLARIPADNSVHGFRIRQKANVRMQNDEPELYQSLGSHSSSPRIRVSIDLSPTNILLEDHFSKGTAEEIAQESEDNLRTPPFIEVTGSGGIVASQDVAKRSVWAQPTALEMAAQGAMESFRESWLSQLQAPDWSIAAGIGLAQPFALDMMTQGAMESFRESWSSQLQTMNRIIAERSVWVQPTALDMMTQGAMESFRESWSSQLQTMNRIIAERSVWVQPTALDMMTQGAMESFRESWLSQLQTMNRIIAERSVWVQPTALDMMTQGAMESFRESWLSQLQTPAWSMKTAWPSIVQEFANGIEGVIPEPEVVERAARLVEEATKHFTSPEFTVDSDGALAFDLQLPSGYLMLAELFHDGTLGIGVYDESSEANKTVNFVPDATDDDMTDWFRERK